MSVGHSGARLFIDDEVLPVEEITMKVETVTPNLSDGRKSWHMYELRQLSEFTFTCEVDLKWLPPLPDPLCDIEFHYITYKRRLFVDVPLKNRVTVKGTREVGHLTRELSAEVTFQGGDWSLELEGFTWKKWWKALCAKLGGRDDHRNAND